MNHKYYIQYSPSKSRFDFRYAAYSGEDYPYGHLINIEMTKRGACRLVKRQQRRDAQGAKLTTPAVVIWRSP